MTRLTIFNTPVLTSVARVLASLFLKFFGWEKEGELPSFPKYVLIGAPHTSNWDLPIVMAFAFAYEVQIYWMGKDSIFRWPYRSFFKWFGGIPIDRSRAHNTVEATIDVFKEHDRLIICIPPEGTRGKARRWKTGFYHIAHGANVPIVLGFMDYERKRGGIGPTLIPGGDIEADMKTMSDFYMTVTGKHPERSGKVTASPDEE